VLLLDHISLPITTKINFPVRTLQNPKYKIQDRNKQDNNFFTVFYSGMDALFPEILFLITKAPQESVGEAGIDPGTAA
jgi:hypothetical protein